MRIYGIDFTSDPSARTSKAKKAKRMHVATCELVDDLLIVESLDELNAQKANDYRHLSDILKSAGPWIAGIDVPFGMPLECIEYFGWLEDQDEEQSWLAYIERVRMTSHRKEFKALIETWRHPTKVNSSGDRERVRKFRIVDKLINSQSPMNCIRPAVGSMFFEVCELLRNSPASVPPVRRLLSETRHIVETYPRLVVNRLESTKAYKEADDLEDVRRRILTRMVDGTSDSPIRKWYGLAVEAACGIREQCVSDREGDKIDSVLCAVQAAWASRQCHLGIPRFNSSIMNGIVALEGWVPDPYLAEWTRPAA